MQNSVVSSWGMAWMSFLNCEFFGNSAKTKGGALFCAGKAVIIISSCRFIANSAGVDGGALYVERAAEVLALKCSFMRNTVRISEANWETTLEGGLLFCSACSLKSHNGATALLFLQYFFGLQVPCMLIKQTYSTFLCVSSWRMRQKVVEHSLHGA